MGRVLSVASECVPLVKTGGLADVVGALPGALAPRGWEMRVLIPAYPGVLEKLGRVSKPLWRAADLFGGPARLVSGEAGGVSVLALQAPHLFDRAGGPYGGPAGDHPDNPERFAALCWVAAEIAGRGLGDGWRPDLLHAHDWQGGLAPAYLRQQGSRVPSVLTIHNIAFQGLAPADRRAALRLEAGGYRSEGYEYWGQISTLKAGLVWADAITTVSPSYAEELMRPEFGMGLEGVIRNRAADLTGILNGTDTAVWDPGRAPVPYSARAMKGKAANRAALLAECGLGAVPGPLAIVVSRLTGQKGIDLIVEAAPGFVAQGGGLIVLGSGEPELEQALRDLAGSHPERVAVRIGYDEALSQRMFAGGDAVLVPSRFEPCGLTQMYGLRFGTIPVVAATGGLADTVITANPAALQAGVATGLTFHPTDALALGQSLRRLVELHAAPALWAALQRRAMRADVSWEASSRAYAALYDRLTTRPGT
ncbi:glycogen synthase GlgA [Frigidibacter sp. ROC022]|uniref:glycogen synthase GlgA n=1 Tax=Frigidibacter sp. ROC022 TaxID=2971796 RepID=UPI00215A9DAE|nr:glycogen synthase GlgA [Frigidibacter sp. ROC022]MCR8725686.1 glycogen synthase GlgA [Frigidibacter sp. ROC022]